MALQTLTSVIYDIVQHSWSVASITAKYYLLALLIYLQSQKQLNKENLNDKIIEDSRFVVSGIVIVGTGLYAVGANISPLFTLLSEAIALGYLGYLFWEY